MRDDNSMWKQMEDEQQFERERRMYMPQSAKRIASLDQGLNAANEVIVAYADQVNDMNIKIKQLQDQVAELRRIAAVTEELDEAKAQIKTNEQIIQGILTINAEHKRRAEAAEAENTALKARIAEAEKQQRTFK